MNAATRSKPQPQHQPQKCSPTHRNASALLPLLVASASAATLIATPAHALELGQLHIESTLGQPLRASIAYALSPTEQLYDFCIALAKGPSDTGLPRLTKARISVADNRILINGTVPIKEPLLSMRLTVDCPYTVHLARQFTLMLDPQETPTIVSNEPAVSNSAGTQRALEAQEAAPSVAGRSAASNSPVTTGAQYRVQIGDTLSEIAGRIENRPVDLWAAVQQLFDANPGAFFDGDVNRLKAGYLLTIPFLQKGAVVATSTPAAVDSPPATDEQSSAASASTYEGFSAPAQVIEDVQPAQPETEAIAEAEPLPVEQAPEVSTISEPVDEITDDTAVLSAGEDRISETTVDNGSSATVPQPGDVFVGASIPANAELEVQQRPASIVATPAEESAGMPSWLVWLLSAGLALVAGLLVFGRGLRNRLGGGDAAQSLPARRATDTDATATNQALGDIDFQFDDPAPGNVDMVLDADLGAGTGLLESDEMDVAQDFGFSATADVSRELDMVFPEDEGGNVESAPTDIIPAQRQDQSSILEREVLPDEDDDGDYDLSMIVDATKQPIADLDGTAKELNAVQIVAESLVDYSSSSLSQEIDLTVLEQDYEDELTATQALNEEIEKAAMELASRMDDEHTAEMPTRAGDNMDSELTAEMPVAVAENDDIGGDLDDTGVNEELTANIPMDDDTGVNEELTASLEIDDDTGTLEELTADFNMNDATVEMDIESGTLDTKKLAG